MGTALTAEGHNWSRSLFDGILRGSSIKIDFYRTIILSLVLYGCESRSLTLRDERRLRVFENRVLMKIFGSKRYEVRGIGENYIMRSLVICTALQLLFG